MVWTIDVWYEWMLVWFCGIMGGLTIFLVLGLLMESWKIRQDTRRHHSRVGGSEASNWFDSLNDWFEDLHKKKPEPKPSEYEMLKAPVEKITAADTAFYKLMVFGFGIFIVAIILSFLAMYLTDVR